MYIFLHAKQFLRNLIKFHLDFMYEGRLKGSWAGGNAQLLRRGRLVTVTPSCTGGGNVVVA
jgi:hypothetical protein